MSNIYAGSTTTTALITTGDTSGNLVLQTGSTPTTAMTINSSQIVNFANAPTVGGAPLPSGAMTLISTQTAISGTTTSLQWTGLSGYDKYQLIIESIKPDSSDYPIIQLGTGSTTWLTSGYATGTNFCYTGSSASAQLFAATSGFGRFANQPTSSSYEGLSAVFTIINFTNVATSDTSCMSSATFQNTNGYYSCTQSGFLTSNTTPKTAIQVTNISGNTFAGKASLYGISS